MHLILDGLLLIEVDRQPAAEACPGAIFDPAARSPYSKQHVIGVRAKTPCLWARPWPRDQLDSQALLGVSDEHASRLDAWRADYERPGTEP